MTEAAAPQQRMTNKEFLAWAEAQEEPYELVDGVPLPLWRHDSDNPTMMAPPSRRHQDIVTNTKLAIRQRLSPPCWVADGIAMPIEAGGTRVPDVVAACVEHDEASNTVDEPVLVVEVLSPSNEGYDRSIKLDEYKQITSIREIWLIASNRRWAQVWLREPDTWRGVDAIGLGGFDSVELEARVTLDELYAGVGL